jgi:hypothetical protein
MAARRRLRGGDPLDDEIAVQTGQRGDGSSCEALEPVRHGASRRDAHQVAEAPEERIVGDILQMLQPPAADEKQSDHDQHQAPRAVITARGFRCERFADTPSKLQAAKEPADDLQSGVRSQLLGAELDA